MHAPHAQITTPAHWPSARQLDYVCEAYERGQTLDAFERSLSIAPLAAWHGTRACIIGARIAANAGSPSLALRLAARAWKKDRTSAAACVQYGYDLFRYRGPVLVWQLLRNWRESASTTPDDLAELFALRCRAAADMRDFPLAESWLAQARSIAPRAPWFQLQLAHLLERQDRVEEALDAAVEACEMHRSPCYRPGVQTRAHLLQQLDRDCDAINLLEDAISAIQNGPVVAQLYSLYAENDCWREANNTLERYPHLTPLLDDQGRQWLTAQRAQVAYRLGLRSEAALQASCLKDKFYKDFARRLQEPVPAMERLELDVTFVRQHFKTCAPATLAAIVRYWNLPADHLKLAEAICYDGTPPWQQRDWAEKNGWIVRDFRVTFESAIELLERGAPFAISTVEATSSHMMAVIGFDRTRNTLLLRDPGQPYVAEYDATAFLDRQRAHGPRGRLFIPRSEEQRVKDVLLADERQYDLLHEITLALERHDRPTAAAALATLESGFPGDIIALDGGFELALYDANGTLQSRCAANALEPFPDNAARMLRRSWTLRDSSRQERLDFLGRACAGKSPDSALLVEYARVQQEDARTIDEARKAVKRALRQRFTDSHAIQTLANLLWDESRYEEATELYRFAATLEDSREHLFQTWFTACRRTRKTVPALEHLKHRFAHFGSRSDQPALTLAWALTQLNEPAKAADTLNEAIQLRPESGTLRLRAATVNAEIGQVDTAIRLLDSARGLARPGDVLRARMSIAESIFDYVGVRQAANALVEIEPVATDAHAAIARALSQREGPAAALAYLVSITQCNPHHIGLKRLYAEWSRESTPADWESAARALLEVEPADGWALRELALALCKQKRFVEAMNAARESRHIEPRNSWSASVLGICALRGGDIDAAREAFRTAVELSVDNDDAIGQLLDLADTDAKRRDVLQHVKTELIRQVVTGNGLLAFSEHARPVLKGDELLRVLRDAGKARPDLWHAWSALIAQLGHLGHLDEALDAASEAARKFPHLPRCWLDLSMAHRWRRELELEITAARQAVELGGAWSEAVEALADALSRAGRLDEAAQVFDSALKLAPGNARLNACSAELQWRLQNPDAAFAAVERALRFAPNFSWAWNLLVGWSEQLRQEERARNFARSLIEERPGEPRGWMMLAEVAGASHDERIDAIDHAIALDPRSAEPWDRKAELLANAERFDDAISTCTDGLKHVEANALVLRGRIAWVEAHRRRFGDAIALMQAVLAENSGYVWGWRQLSQWQLESEDLAGAAASLESLRRLRPFDGWISRELGFCKLQQKDRTGARDAFRSALDVSPDDVSAAHNLLDLQIEDGDLAGANETLRIILMNQPGAGSKAAVARVRLREGNIPEALTALESLGMSNELDRWPLVTTTDLLLNHPANSRAVRVLRRCLSRGGSPECAVSIVRLLCTNGRYFTACRFFRQLPDGEAWRRAAEPLIQELARRRRKLLFSWLLWTRRDMLFKDDTAWGSVGYALASAQNMKATAKWLSDWQRRPNVQPWMLFNYCLALRCQGHHDDAHDVATHVVEHWSHRDGADALHIMLAIEHSLRRNVDAAEASLHVARRCKAGNYDEQMVALATELVALQKTPRDSRPERWPSHKSELRPHFPLYGTLFAMRDIRLTLRRAARHFAEEGAGRRASAWFAWRLHWQWAMAPVVPASIAVMVAAGAESLVKIILIFAIGHFTVSRLYRNA